MRAQLRHAHPRRLDFVTDRRRPAASVSMAPRACAYWGLETLDDEVVRAGLVVGEEAFASAEARVVDVAAAVGDDVADVPRADRADGAEDRVGGLAVVED